MSENAVVITLDPCADLADPSHDTGLTEDAYCEIATFLSGYGYVVSIDRFPS